MRNALLTVMLLLLVSPALPALADGQPEVLNPGGDGGCVVDNNTEGCFSTGGGTGGGTTADGCIKSTNYNTCVKRCKCQFDKNVKKCKGGQACTALAESEKSACDGGCITDYVF